MERVWIVVFIGLTLLSRGKEVQEIPFQISRELENFRTNLPILVIANGAQGSPTDEHYQTGRMAWIEPVEGWASFAQGWTGESWCGVKKRGSSSVNDPKWPLALEIRDEKGKDRALPLAGLPRNSDWVLTAPYFQDRAAMRNALIYRLSNQAGLYAPRTRFVELFFNRHGGKISYRRDYRGVYVLTEKIKNSPERVALRERGYLFKHDRPDPGDIGFSVGGMGTFYWVSPKERKVTKDQKKELSSHLTELSVALQAPDGINPATQRHFTDDLDLQSWLLWHWLSEFAKNIDTYKASAYFHREGDEGRRGRIKAGPLWDFDRSMNSMDRRDNDPHGWVAIGSESSEFEYPLSPWWGQLLAHPDARQAHIDLWAELRADVLSWTNLEAQIDALAAELQHAEPPREGSIYKRSPIERNYWRWRQVRPRGGTHAHEVDLLKRWLQKRLAWIDGQFLGPPQMGVASQVVQKGQRITLQKEGEDVLYYTLGGTDPRLSGGGIHPKASNKGEFVVQESVTLIARQKKGEGLKAWSAPVRRTFVVGNPATAENIELVKIHADPKGAKTDQEKKVSQESSDFEYLEIKNRSAQAVELAGLRFVDGIKLNRSKLRISSLKAGQSAFFVRNAQAFQARYGKERAQQIAGEYGPYRLDNRGEILEMVDFRGQTIFRKDIGP